MGLSFGLQDVDIDLRYKRYSTSTRKSLEAWSGSQLDLGLVNNVLYNILVFVLEEICAFLHLTVH